MTFSSDSTPSAVARMRSILSHIASASGTTALTGSDSDNDATTSSSNGSTMVWDPAARSTATRWNGWGFSDTRLFVNADHVVELSGDRYSEVFDGARDRTLPLLLPFAEKMLGIDTTRQSLATNADANDLVVIDQPVVPGSVLQQQLVAFLELLERGGTSDNSNLTMRTSVALEDRVRHGHGQTCEEIFKLRHLREIARIPDAVVWPTSHAHVELLVREAVAHSASICLIPHGGGTNVSNALNCDATEHRAIVSIDMRDMRRILAIDRANMTVRAEAGITGLELHDRLRVVGLTLGHEPDSWEFSTLGGYVATRASGMKKNAYGNIEDLVVHLRTVTTQGTMAPAAVVPRVSMGPNTTQLLLGSEGILGVFTEVTLRVRRFPQMQRYDSLVFPTFTDGVECMQAIQRTLGATVGVPASIRLLDNTQFQLGQALKGASSSHSYMDSVVDYATKLYVTTIRGFAPSQMVAATVLMEGDASTVTQQQQAIHALAKRYRGLVGGAASGHRGYKLTYMIAYLRDFAMDYYFLSESFETAVPWTNVSQLCIDIKHAISRVAAASGVRIPPLIACRVTQLYDTGVAVYVYYGVYYYGVPHPLAMFRAIETAAVDAIVTNGGSLSHHHGVGKHRRAWLTNALSQPAVAAIQGLKTALDPSNVFAANNILVPNKAN